MALKADGTVLSWESYTRVEESVPALPGPAIAIACGNQRSVALTEDGSVFVWDDDGLIPTPEDLGEVVAIEAALYFSMALRIDGTVRVWGPLIGPQTVFPNDVV